MTPNEQRIAIAQACGWKGISPEYLTGYAPWRPTPYSERVMGDLDSLPIDPLPDYLNDLNAMHEAENHFVGDASKAMTYAMHLLRACGLFITSEYDELNVDYCWHACHATAAQRAKAFLRTLNLWK